MKLVKVGSAILNQTPLAWEENVAHILGAIQAAKERGISFLALPELCITGYGCEDTFLANHVQKTALELLLKQIIPSTKGLFTCAGLPLAVGGSLFNAIAVICDEKLLGFVLKRNLAGEGIHYEPRWFKPWPRKTNLLMKIENALIPTGDLIFNVGGVKVGFEICEEAWVAERPGIDLGKAGVDLILNPSASHFAIGKHEVRKRFTLEASRAFGASYLYSNLVGNEAGRAIYDGGALIASAGKLLCEGPRFSYQNFLVSDAVIDVESSQFVRQRSTSQIQETASSVAVIECDFRLPAYAGSTKPSHLRADWETSSHLREEEIGRCLALGLFDYHRKSHSNGFVVSMSGGADSSATCCLVALSLHFADAELGLSETAKRFGVSLEGASTVAEYMRKVLFGLYQKSKNSSEETFESARVLSTFLGMNFGAIEIGSLVSEYQEKIEAILGASLSWEKNDLALQNIQARVRSPSVWLLANVKGALLLSTSNRSEVAAGYATMDGDTSGGLAPLGGLDKSSVLSFLKWLEKVGPKETGPFTGLKNVNQLKPSPELRPPSARQTAESDLMPYPLLNFIEQAFIKEKRSPAECFQLASSEYPDLDREQLRQWVKKFFQLWTKNQWKRERYAPCFHVDDANLDPRTWCRYPILSGGYEKELKEF